MAQAACWLPIKPNADYGFSGHVLATLNWKQVRKSVGRMGLEGYGMADKDFPGKQSLHSSISSTLYRINSIRAFMRSKEKKSSSLA